MEIATLAVLFVVAALVWNVWADLQAAERATVIAKRTCDQAGVLWLDQNVQRVKKRPARNADGRMSWRRDFDFEFSTSGEERQLGRVSLLGTSVISVVGPAPAPTVYVGR